MGSKFLYILIISIFIVSCSEKPITIDQLRDLESNSRESINATSKASKNAFNDVSKSFKKLSEYLENNQLSDKDLKRMESMLVDLNKKREKFNSSLANAKDSGNEFIDILKRRANENSEKEMRKNMLSLISAREEAFDKVISNTKSQIKELDKSIQRFDNIVGYLQINAGLKGIDSITNQIEELRESVLKLEQLVDSYIIESKELMKHYES